MATILRVAPSTIRGAGLGLFARQAIEAGELIAQYTGERLDGEEFSHRLRTNRTSGDFALRVARGVYIDAEHTPWCLPRYINDATGSELSNNCRFVLDAERESAAIHTVRSIHAGEELLVPYGEGYWLAWELRNSVL